MFWRFGNLAPRPSAKHNQAPNSQTHNITYGIFMFVGHTPPRSLRDGQKTYPPATRQLERNPFLDRIPFDSRLCLYGEIFSHISCFIIFDCIWVFRSSRDRASINIYFLFCTHVSNESITASGATPFYVYIMHPCYECPEIF